MLIRQGRFLFWLSGPEKDLQDRKGGIDYVISYDRKDSGKRV